MENLAKKKKIRGGHRGHLTKIVSASAELLEVYDDERKLEAAQMRDNVLECVATIQKIDEEILDIIAEDKDSTSEDITSEVEEAARVSSDAKRMAKLLSEKLHGGELSGEQTQLNNFFSSGNATVSDTSNLPIGKTVCAKLPKLHVKRFHGNICEWQEFWDSFESAIHANSGLSEVDKFNYLRGLVDEPAKSCIAGYSLTTANYKAAVEALRERYGKPSAVQRAHVQRLMSMDRVRDENDVRSLRRLCDGVETHFRGLEALGVDKETYSSVVVPYILNLLPDSIRLLITRGQKSHEWNVDDFVKHLKGEIDLREEQRGQREFQDRRRDRELKRTGPSTASALFTNSKVNNCAFCLGSHRAEDCEKVKAVEERKKLIRKYSRCFKCLKKGHLARNCNTRVNCSACKKDHHTALCDSGNFHEPMGSVVNREVGKDAVNTLVISPQSNNNSNDSVSINCVKSSPKVALQTAQAMLVGRSSARVRVLLDSGSQRSFVTVNKAKTLGCTVLREESLSLGTFGRKASESVVREVVKLDLKSLSGGVVFSIEAFVVPRISSLKNLHLEIVKENYSHLRELWLSDVCKTKEDLEVDVLIGADFLWLFQGDRILRGAPGEPVAIETKLGWVISGPVASEGNESVQVNFVTSEMSGSNSNDVSRFWDLETIGIKPDKEVHESVISNLKFNGQRYSVGLPWRENHDHLPNNYDLSLKRMQGQIRRLNKDPELLREYDSIIKAQEKAGIIERVSTNSSRCPESKIHYIPHQAVVRRMAETTKVRIVYDASAKVQKFNVSLNDCLHAGPSLNPLLLDILLRFREQRIALVADIEKAFLNIEIHDEDRNSLRFLWVEDVLRNKMNVIVYRFCRVVFGVCSSPFLLNATLRHHIGRYSKQDAKFAEKMLKSFYVDDLASGENNIEEAYLLYAKTKQRLAEGGFRLHKWRTNDPDLRARINEQDVSGSADTDEQTYAKTALACQAGNQAGKVLGLEWDSALDLIKFTFDGLIEKARKTEASKRNVLSLLACIFDPLGLLSPSVAKAKILFQDICISGLDWDDTLSKNFKERWEKWLNDFSETTSVTIDRYLSNCGSVTAENAQYWLHGFGDASKRAYCAVIYLVIIVNDKTFVKLIASKTRVAPIKELTIPRLELMAARILAQLMHAVKKALEFEYTFKGTRFWTDSKTVLCWIRNPGDWKQFVQHRVTEISKLSSKHDWGHCPGKENPADLGSRGVLISELKNSSLWWFGPEWLKGKPCEWPSINKVIPTLESKVEEKKSFCVNVLLTVKSLCVLTNVISLSKFSSLIRLLRVTAWVKRFVWNLKQKKEMKEVVGGELSVCELKTAEKEWTKIAQEELKNEESFNQLKRAYGLEEKDEILRCCGRLGNSDLEIEAKEPIVLPKGHKFTQLVVKECHDTVMHSGVRSTLAKLRTKYWIPKGRQEVKKIISACLVCKKWNCKPCSKPQQAALPEFRVTRAAPFQNSGVDFAGPLFVKGKTGMDKVYVALFTCCTTRAVHLELVQDLTAATFLRCLRRFASRRGTPQILVSDNAKTFKAADKILTKIFKSVDVKSSLSKKGIEWRFNLERAPWWGGFFERLIGLVKTCLRKVLGQARLNFDELVTVLVEVEATLNSRPLTYEDEEVSTEVLTPSHLIYGRQINSLPGEQRDSIEDSDKLNSVTRFNYITKVLEHFWNRWRTEYLTNLREFHKTGTPDAKCVLVKQGDVVIVFERGRKRGEWKTGVVQEEIKGKDGVLRGAKVCVITNGQRQLINRPVQHLYPVEVKNPQESEEVVVGEAQVAQRRKRNAALNAKGKIKALFDT